ncbi:hypothetical protein D3C72_1462090 [compost metagenome]
MARSLASSSASQADLKSHQGREEKEASKPASRKAARLSGARPGVHASSRTSGRCRRNAANRSRQAEAGRRCGAWKTTPSTPWLSQRDSLSVHAARKPGGKGPSCKCSTLRASADRRGSRAGSSWRDWYQPGAAVAATASRAQRSRITSTYRPSRCADSCLAACAYQWVRGTSTPSITAVSASSGAPEPPSGDTSHGAGIMTALNPRCSSLAYRPGAPPAGPASRPWRAWYRRKGVRGCGTALGVGTGRSP